MKKLFFLYIIISPFITKAQDYKISLIPDSLLKDANAVKRFEEVKVEIRGIDKAVVKHKWAYTVLNESGEEFATYMNVYDKFHSLSDISGRMFDTEGKLIKSIKKKDIADVAINDGESLITDARTKHFSFYNKSYPYTVEFEDEVVDNGIFSLPEWTPIDDNKLSVQRSSLVVETPADYKLRYKQLNWSIKPQINSNGKTIVYTWELLNTKAVLEEDYEPKDMKDILPVVFIAPTEFEFAGYKGDMSTWNDFGKFIFALFSGRDALPENIKQDVHRITDPLPSKEEKIKALYAYLQQNTRYVSIQLGIGSLQPFEAKYVAEKKYGDCKALSNYMVALLKEAGIKAYCVLVDPGDGKKGLMEDFPSSQFRHVIACVPDVKDTIWLECTDQTISLGYMGDFTGDRKALLISENGGFVLHTPKYTADDNLQLRKVDAFVDVNGNITVDVNTHFTGTQQDLQHSLMYQASKDEREKYLNSRINLPTYKVEKNDYQEIKGKVPAINEYLKITSENYASVTSKRIFIQANLFNHGKKIATDKQRQLPIELSFSYRDVDTIHIRIPDGYIAESTPKDLAIANKFGKYSINYKVAGNNIDLLRINERNAGVFPATDYTEFAKFYDDIYKADRAKIVLIKK